jgi:hypothetical protein
MSLAPGPTNEGASRVPGSGCGTLSFPNRLTRKEQSTMVKLRSCERLHTDFPVMFAGETYVGEGTVLNVSIPGCAIQSRKRVQPGSYLEMRLLMPDSASPLRVGLAKVRWCEERRFGVEFIQMPDGDQVRLGQIIKNDALHLQPSRSDEWEGKPS